MQMRIAVFVVLCSACASSPWSHVAVRARSLNAGARDATGIVAVPDAVVALSCPDGKTQQIGRTDADGALYATPEVDLPLDCAITVAQDGFATERAKVYDSCRLQGNGVCRDLDLSLVLARAGDSRVAKKATEGTPDSAE
jgi:hypothetical protein